NYQAPTFSNPPGGAPQNPAKGGILSWGLVSPGIGRWGSSADFGAFGLGLIEGNNTDRKGFYSAQSINSYNYLSFANANNISSNYWGGYFGGDVPQLHCIPDYYGTKQNSPSPYPFTDA